MKRYLIISFLLFAFLSVSAQNDTIVKKFGDVKPEDFVPTELEKMGGYKAVILLNQRVSSFNTYEHQVMFFDSYHIRYKALEANFFENNQFVVPYSGRYDYERVINTKVRVYRLSGQKVIEHKIKFKDINVVNRDSLKSKLIVSLPEINAGDIVDIQYTKASFNYSNPEEWNFHSEYPCKISQVITDFPDFIEYQYLVTGDTTLVQQDTRSHYLSITENYSQANRPLSAFSERGQLITFRFAAFAKVFTAYNTLPVDTIFAFMPQKNFFDSRLLMRPKHISEDIKQSPYLSNAWSRLTRLLFAYDEPGNRYLSKFEVWNQIVSPGFVKFESNNWKRFTKRQRQSPYFWKPILKSFVLNDKLSEIYENADAMDSFTLVTKLYDYVTHNIKWNGIFDNCIYQNPEMVIKQGSGSSAEINATLVALFRRAGLDALPVYSATRDFGMVDSSYVNTLQFNNILAYVSFVHNDNILNYVIDATNPERKFDVLNTQNINNQYLVMDLENHFFVSVSHDYADTLELTAQINGNSCHINSIATGVFIDEPHLKDTTLTFNGSNLKSAFKMIMGENPFPEAERTVPVDFVVPRHYTYRVKTNTLKANDFVPYELSSVDDHLKAHATICNEDGYTVYQLDVDITTPFFDVPLYYYVKSFFDKVYSVAD